jgi:hypothetical protein
MKMHKFGIITVLSVCLFMGCSESGSDPTPDSGNGSGTTPPGTTNPPATKPDFLPAGYTYKPNTLLSKVTLEVFTGGNHTKTTNTYNYDQYGRFTEIRSKTEGVSGEAVNRYTYKDAEKKIEFSYTGLNGNDNYKGEALLNNDYTIREVTLEKPGENSKTTYTYSSDGKVASQKFDSNLKSYEEVYTYGEKGIIKSERKNYRAKASSEAQEQNVILEWSYGDVTSEEYHSLTLSEPNFPQGYLGKYLTKHLPVQNKSDISAKMTTPITIEYKTTSVTNYQYTLNSEKKVVKIDTESNANTFGINTNIRTISNLEYKAL